MGKLSYQKVSINDITPGDIFRTTGCTRQYRAIRIYLVAKEIPTVEGHSLDGKRRISMNIDDVLVLGKV